MLGEVLAERGRLSIHVQTGGIIYEEEINCFNRLLSNGYDANAGSLRRRWRRR